MTTTYFQLVPNLLNIAKEAGDAIMSFYQQEKALEVEIKADSSPLTAADIAAHQIIKNGLLKLTPEIPLLSEEETDISFEVRKTWEKYWLVDPLDGTKEFIHRTDEFTVNIALIENGEPIIGVIYAPVLQVFYYAAKGQGAFKQSVANESTRIHTRAFDKDNLTLAVSRRHGSKLLQNFLKEYSFAELITKGSSLKSCLIAEGNADIYPCLGQTSEWDIAAAQCIVIEAGGKVFDFDLQPLRYNTKPSFLNSPLFIVGDAKYDWPEFLKQIKLT